MVKGRFLHAHLRAVGHTPTDEGASCVPEVRGDRRRDATCRGVGRAGCYSATLQA